MKRLLWLAASLLLAACDHSSQPSTPKAAEANAGVYSSSINFSATTGFNYTIYDASLPEQPAVGGAIVRPLGGGDANCCIQLPKQWRPGLTLLLRWHPTDRTRSGEDKLEKLEIPRYDKVGPLYVAFYGTYEKPEVEVFVTPEGLGSPHWPGRINDDPMSNCYKTQPKKVCDRQTPEYLLTLSPYEMLHECDLKNLSKLCKEAYQDCLDTWGKEDCDIKAKEGTELRQRGQDTP